jgi:hypothetical protein
VKGENKIPFRVPGTLGRLGDRVEEEEIEEVNEDMPEYELAFEVQCGATVRKTDSIRHRISYWFYNRFFFWYFIMM